MRIRKRKVPLPLSMLSPVPLTDPNLFSRSPVILVQQAAGDDLTQDNTKQSQPYDHLTCDLGRLINDGSSTSDDHHDNMVIKCDDPLMKEQELGCCLTLGEAEVRTVQKNNDDNRKKNITVMGATAANIGPSPFSNDEGRWCNGDKSIPLKKRRGSFEISANVDTEKHLKTIMNGNEQKAEITNNNSSNNNVVSAKKASKRGNTIMEGSRCSRVNGRGWRCCQPTLVGYSLCEHHLGKGRLRSMTSVRGRPSLSKKAALGTSSASASPSLLPSEESETVRSENKRTSACTKSCVGKRSKLGVVKARSLSSLLGQTITTMSSTMNNIALAVDQEK